MLRLRARCTWGLCCHYCLLSGNVMKLTKNNTGKEKVCLSSHVCSRSITDGGQGRGTWAETEVKTIEEVLLTGLLPVSRSRYLTVLINLAHLCMLGTVHSHLCSEGTVHSHLCMLGLSTVTYVGKGLSPGTYIGKELSTVDLSIGNQENTLQTFTDQSDEGNFSLEVFSF